MITSQQRAHLRAKTIPGDIPRAAQIYETITKRKINKSQLQKFINNQHPFHNQRPESHSPLKMYEAIAQAIEERLERERNDTIQASKIFKQKIADTIEANQLILEILADTQPTQPIHL